MFNHVRVLRLIRDDVHGDHRVSHGFYQSWNTQVQHRIIEVVGPSEQYDDLVVFGESFHDGPADGHEIVTVAVYLQHPFLHGFFQNIHRYSGDSGLLEHCRYLPGLPGGFSAQVEDWCNHAISVRALAIKARECGNKGAVEASGLDALIGFILDEKGQEYVMPGECSQEYVRARHGNLDGITEITGPDC